MPNCRVESRRKCTDYSQVVGDCLDDNDESEQICRRNSTRRLVANWIYIGDATQLDSWVSSASAVYIQFATYLWQKNWKLNMLIIYPVKLAAELQTGWYCRRVSTHRPAQLNSSFQFSDQIHRHSSWASCEFNTQRNADATQLDSWVVGVGGMCLALTSPGPGNLYSICVRVHDVTACNMRKFHLFAWSVILTCYM